MNLIGFLAIDSHGPPKARLVPSGQFNLKFVISGF